MKKCKHCEEEHSLPGQTCRVCKDGLYRYNMTRLDQLKLYESQGKVCILCDSEIKMFSGHTGGFIDHDHKTGDVRGVLCNRCNTVVGGLENHKNITKLLKYLNIGV
jgi:hypothetical protein